MITKKLPFQEETVIDTIDSIVENYVNYQYINDKVLIDLLSRMLNKNPLLRLSAEDA